MRVLRLSALAAVALSLAACQTTGSSTSITGPDGSDLSGSRTLTADEQALALDHQCRTYYGPRGSQLYNACRLSLEASRQRNSPAEYRRDAIQNVANHLKS